MHARLHRDHCRGGTDSAVGEPGVKLSTTPSRTTLLPVPQRFCAAAVTAAVAAAATVPVGTATGTGSGIFNFKLKFKFNFKFF